MIRSCCFGWGLGHEPIHCGQSRPSNVSPRTTTDAAGPQNLHLMTKTTAPNPTVAGKPRPVRTVFLVAALLVVLGVGFMGGPIRQWIATQAVLANDAPRLDTLDELITNARDPARTIRAAWATGKIVHRQAAIRSFVHLLRRLNHQFSFEVTAHPSVEVTLFHQPDRSRYVLTLVSFQHDLPSLPVDDIQIRLSFPRGIREVRCVPSGDALRFRSAQGVVTFTAPRLRTLAMLALTYA
jgi:hypothetical protein